MTEVSKKFVHSRLIDDCTISLMRMWGLIDMDDVDKEKFVKTRDELMKLIKEIDELSVEDTVTEVILDKA